jgi:hypothetical protein
MALFGYAMDQPDSFRMLFDSLDGESSPEQRNLYDLMIERVAQRIRSYRADRGRATGPSAQLLAEMLVGLVGRAVGHTLRDDQLDREPVGELIVSFVASALRHVDSAAIEAVDRTSVPRDSTPA